MEMYTSEESDISISPTTPKKQKLTALDKLLGPKNLTMETCTFDSELERYLAESSVSRKQNPLIWWKTNSSRYKVYLLLFSVYCVYLLRQHPQTVDSIISKARLTVTKYLKPKHVDALIKLE